MASENSELRAEPSTPERYVSPTVAESVKILVVGAFGVGKTTLIGAVSEIPPLRTEETMTTASIGIDPDGGADGKTTTTVAMDFGRITVSPEIVLYLFGTPGQRRFWDLWEGLAEGAVGVLVLVDTREVADSFEVLDQLEVRTTMPFAVALNEFPDAPKYPTEQLRDALDLLPETPIVSCDARSKESAVGALITLVEHALSYSAKSSKALT